MIYNNNKRIILFKKKLETYIFQDNFIIYFNTNIGTTDNYINK